MEQPIICIILPPEEALAHRMRACHRNRVAEIMKGGTPSPMVEGAKLILHLIPDQSIGSSTELTAVAIGEAAQGKVPLGSERGSSRYNAEGFAIVNLGGSPSYVQFYRSGVIEAVLADIVGPVREPEQCTILKAALISRTLIYGLPGYLRIFTALGITPPVRCFVTLTGVKDCRINRGNGFVSDHAIDRDVVELPVATVNDLTVAGHIPFRPIVDVIWNAAGLSKCPHFNAVGLWEDPQQGTHGTVWV